MGNTIALDAYKAIDRVDAIRLPSTRNLRQKYFPASVSPANASHALTFRALSHPCCCFPCQDNEDLRRRLVESLDVDLPLGRDDDFDRLSEQVGGGG